MFVYTSRTLYKSRFRVGSGVTSFIDVTISVVEMNRSLN